MSENIAECEQEYNQQKQQIKKGFVSKGALGTSNQPSFTVVGEKALCQDLILVRETENIDWRTS